MEVEGHGRNFDRKQTRFGIREIKWLLTKAEKPSDSPYRLLVNGRPIRMLGSDLVPPDLLFARAPQRYPRILELAAAAGMNTIRLWGGGPILPDDFYDRADALGIMLSEEFPFANMVLPNDPQFVDNTGATVTDIVRRLRNHPSIIEWGGGNELDWPGNKGQPAISRMAKVVADNDDRIFRPTDPIEGSKHSPWTMVPGNHFKYYNSVDVGRYGEFGTQTPTTLEAFEREIPPSSEWPLEDNHDPVLIRKNVLEAAFTPDDWFYKQMIEAYFGPLPDLPTAIRTGQYIGASSLRYSFDALRRNGDRIGSITSWDLNEPTANGAGSFLINHDGVPLMNYAFVQEALAPISVNLKFDDDLFDPLSGIEAGLWITSDAVNEVRGLKWRWRARDGQGTLLGEGNGSTDVAPRQSRMLAAIRVKPAPTHSTEPVIVELELRNSKGAIINERVQIFGPKNVQAGPLSSLIQSRALVPNSPAPAPLPRRRVLFLDDSRNDYLPNLGLYLQRFGIVLDRVTTDPETVRQALGHDYDVIIIGSPDRQSKGALRDRIGAVNLEQIAREVGAGKGLVLEGDALADESGISTSALSPMLPLKAEKGGPGGPTHVHVVEPPANLIDFPLKGLDGYFRLRTQGDARTWLAADSGQPLMASRVYGKGRVLAYAVKFDVGTFVTRKEQLWAWPLRGSSAFPALFARMLAWTSGTTPDALASITSGPAKNRPIAQTQIALVDSHEDSSGRNERLSLTLANQGAMTALFCSPRPHVAYRTDLMIDPDYVSLPPGETRVINITAPTSQLPLAATGWDISCWNTKALAVAPDRNMLLAVGRKDAMSREFANAGPEQANRTILLEGPAPDAASVPYLLGNANNAAAALKFAFNVPTDLAAAGATLYLDTADQSTIAPSVVIRVNGRTLMARLPAGIGVQTQYPAHLAFPQTLSIPLPKRLLKSGRNQIMISCPRGWLSWDAIELLAVNERSGGAAYSRSANRDQRAPSNH